MNLDESSCFLETYCILYIQKCVFFLLDLPYSLNIFLCTIFLLVPHFLII